MANKQNTKQTITTSHLLFLISGITLIIYYLVSKGVPSIGNSITSIMSFIAELFVLILLIGFYCFFLFGVHNCQGTIKSIAPSLLILIAVESYSMNFGNAAANAVISSIASMFYLLIIVCGFVFLFVHSKLLGLVFCYSTLIYAAFVMLSYAIVMIMTLVNGQGFSVSKLVETILYAGSLSLLFAGSYLATKNKSWSF